MPGPKAIRTKYGGQLFRSRLEARWAVFFDALKIKWEYEPEGYELSDGTCYLPDFWLPTFDRGVYAEVKPDGGDFAKARQFAHEIEKPVWFCEGAPALRAYWVEPPGELHDTWDYTGIPNADQAQGENRMFAAPGYDPSTPEGRRLVGENYVDAVRFATGYSFWEPGGGSPTRLREVVSRRPWR